MGKHVTREIKEKGYSFYRRKKAHRASKGFGEEPLRMDKIRKEEDGGNKQGKINGKERIAQSVDMYNGLYRIIFAS